MSILYKVEFSRSFRGIKLLNIEVVSVFFSLGSMNQSQRLDAMAKLKQFHCRVLISTDLVSYFLTVPDCCKYTHFRVLI